MLALLAPSDYGNPAVVREQLTRMLRGASAAKLEEADWCRAAYEWAGDPG
ncbi:MAG TPA: hypothetical protein VFU97_14920 [Xanthobacteraceae bacterium]|nr:hypothetical protein [Xanthobacteraceae bacterium]